MMNIFFFFTILFVQDPNPPKASSLILPPFHPSHLKDVS